MNRIQAILDDIKDFLSFPSNSSTTAPKNILITGLPRSGTTWFGSMLNTETNLVFHEPYINHTRLWNWNLNANQENYNKHNQITLDILNKNNWGRYQKKNNNKLLNTPFLHKNFITGEFNTIIKDPSLCYFNNPNNTKLFDHIITINRNPLSIVASTFKNRWDPTERLKRIEFYELLPLDSYPQIKLALSQIEQYSLEEKLAIQTKILNILMEKNYPNSINVQYEDFALNPITEFESLYKRLQLNYNINTLSYHKKLTTSKTTTHQRHDVIRESSNYIDIYNKYLTSTQLDRVKNMFQTLNQD